MAAPLKRRPRIAKNKTKLNLPTKKRARPRVRSVPTLKQRTDRAIADIRSRLSVAEKTYYDIGRALLSLRDPEIWKLYAETSYKGFLNAQVMPYSTALRMVTVAEAYPKAVALQIGQERGFQLARLAHHEPKFKKKNVKPADLWTQNAKLGKKRVQSMTGAEIATLVQLAIARTKATRSKPSASSEEQEVYEGLIEDWDSLLGHQADFELDVKKGVVRIEVKISELLG